MRFQDGRWSETMKGDSRLAKPLVKRLRALFKTYKGLLADVLLAGALLLFLWTLYERFGRGLGWANGNWFRGQDVVGSVGVADCAHFHRGGRMVAETGGRRRRSASLSRRGCRRIERLRERNGMMRRWKRTLTG